MREDLYLHFSDRTMALGSTQPLTEIWVPGVFPGGKGGLCVRLTTFPQSCAVVMKSFRSHYDPGVDSASNRNEYQEYFLGVKAAGA